MQALLQASFGDCKRPATSLCNVRSSYEPVSAPQFFVYDSPDPTSTQPSRIVSADEDFQLTVNNPAESAVWFVKTDKCLFTDEVSKCDCLLFNDQKAFLVEIKTSSPGGRSNKRQRAVVQLAATIETLRAAGIDLTTYEARAIICFKRNDTSPIRASLNTQRALFLDKYKISLEEGNIIDF
ncbi:MAG: hypothetical protein JWP69_1343 [Flaviaesturariibacter sp.]|nr:hypothetical protein [Flaviaesturariibacter sp.]